MLSIIAFFLVLVGASVGVYFALQHSVKQAAKPYEREAIRQANRERCERSGIPAPRR